MFNKFFGIVLLVLFGISASAVPNNTEIRVSDLTLENRYEILLAYMTDAVLTKSTDKELEGLKSYDILKESLIADSSSFAQFFRDEDNYWTGNGLNLASYLLKDSSLLSLDALYAQVKHESTDLKQIWLPRIVNSIIIELEASKLNLLTDSTSSTRLKKKKKSGLSSSTWIVLGLLMLLTVGLLIYVIASGSRKINGVKKSSKSRKQKHSIAKPSSNTPFGEERRGSLVNSEQVEAKKETELIGNDNSDNSNQFSIVEDENPAPTFTLSANESPVSNFHLSPIVNNVLEPTEENFFGAPREDASFYMKDALIKGDRLILYRTEGNSSGKIFLDINSTHGKIIESRNRLIEPICESVNAYEIGRHTQLELVEPGDFLLEGDKLRVVKKVKIKYS